VGCGCGRTAAAAAAEVNSDRRATALSAALSGPDSGAGGRQRSGSRDPPEPHAAASVSGFASRVHPTMMN